MSSQQMKLSILIGADASGAKAGGAEAVVAIEDVSEAGQRAAKVLDDVANAGRAVGSGFEKAGTGAGTAAQAIGKVGAAADQSAVSVRKLIEAQTGIANLGANSNLRGADLQAYGAQLDALRAKYNPLFAVVSRYKAEVAGIRQAHSVGAISTNEMTAAIGRERQATLASIDAIKGRNAALRSMPAAANGNVQGFQTSNIAAQFQDIGVTAAMGMSPLQIALQQGTQLSAVFASMENPIKGVGAAIAAVFSPMSLVTIGVVGLTAAVIQYGSAFLSAGRDSEETLQKQKELIGEVAQKWGETLPALKAYFDELKDKEDEKQKLAAVAAAIDLTWAGARASIGNVNALMAEAVERLRSVGASSADILSVQDVFAKLTARVAENKATSEDLRAAQTTLALVFNNEQLPAVEGISTAFESLGRIIDEASGRTKRFAMTGTQELADFEKRMKAIAPYAEAQLKLQQAYRDMYNPSNIPAGTVIPVPADKPSMLDFDPDEEANDKLAQARKKAADELEAHKKAYEDYLRVQDQGIARLALEVSLVGASASERAKSLAAFDAEQKIRELGLKTSSAEAAVIREKAAALATVSQQLTAQSALKSQNDDIARLQLELSLVGASAEVRARSIAAYEVEQQIRNQGIDAISREADALRAGAQARADLRLELERQTAAYQSAQQAGGSMIDALVTGTGTIKDRFRSMVDTALQWIQQMAVANPLKNALTGTNLPTLGDLFSGKPATPLGATSTAAMTVTAGTVMINGAPIGGLPGANPLGLLGAANNNQPGAANQNNPFAAVLGNAGTTKTGTALSSIGVNGQSAQVNSQYAGNFQGFLGELQASGYQVNSLGGYNYRNIAGTDRLSNHAFGNAIDINPSQNPVTRVGQPVISDLPANVGDMAAKYGLQQGMYRTKNDPMHFEVAKGAQPIDATASSLTKLNQTASATAKQIDTMGTGAIDASKALTDGNGSLVSAIGKAAAPTTPAPTTATPAVGGSGNIFSSLFSSLGNAMQGLGSMFSSLFSKLFSFLFADGAAFSGGNVVPFAAGGVVSRPTLFPMSGGRRGVMGEAGPEAIMPLHRGPGGKLGVAMAMPRQMRQGGGEMKVSMSSTNNINVYGNGDAELRAQFEAGTQQMLDIRDRQWRSAFPGMIEEYQANPDVRSYG